MANTDSSQAPKVALWGINHEALLFGRACTLAEIPLVGLHDSDPVKALQASLFLGVSATSNLREFMEPEPTIVIAAEEPPEHTPDKVELLLLLNRDTSLRENDPKYCTLSTESVDSRLPQEITSRLPPLAVSLSGNAEAIQRARDFLSKLRTVFEISVTS